MKHGFIKTAAVTPDIRVADVAYNTESIIKNIDEAKEAGARIIVFPELCITGYTCGDLFTQEILLTDARKALHRIAAHTKEMDALVFVGVPLAIEGELYNVAAALHRGEILGLAGVEGNGQKEAAEVLCGLIRKYRGLVTVEGQELAGRSVRRIRALGVAHIPEDRLRTGCDPDGSIFDNLIALCCDSESRLGFLREKRLKARVKEVIGRYSVKGTPGQKMCSLSGGNMQKVIVARELEASPVLLVADQPTRGVDIGSIAFIHQKLTELRDRGGAVLLVSADMSEMFALSDRILVFHGGEIVAEITDVQGTSEEQLGRYMLGIDRMEVTHG